MNSLINLSPQQLRKAADLQERIVALQSELAGLLGEPAAVPAPAAPGAKPAARRRISAAGIERIRAAQRARWAKAHAGKAPKATAGKRRMSPAARAKIAARMKAVWAARRNK
jgi:hypothetical protein